MRHVAEPFSLVQPLPIWVRCVFCGRSLLGSHHTLNESERQSVARKIAAQDLAPFEHEGSFHVTVVCRNCGEPHHVAGESSGDVDVDADGAQSYITVYQPRWLWPVPPLLDVSPRLPKTIKFHLDRAAALFWPEPAACLTALRAATEAFLDAQGVRRRDGKRQVALFDRINVFAKDLEPPLADEFRACLHGLREKGNQATHRARKSGFFAELAVANQVREATLLLERVLALKYGSPPSHAITSAKRRLRAKDIAAAKKNLQQKIKPLTATLALGGKDAR